LHQEASATDVLELHGNTRRFRCQGCAAVFDLEAVHRLLAEALPPPCPACGGGIRPDEVLFGEMLPEAVLQASLTAARQADVMLVVGSSLVVQPAASLPVITLERGGQVIIINVGETPLDRVAAATLNADARAILPALAAALLAG
jgi:NAD-dependent deacetylase